MGLGGVGEFKTVSCGAIGGQHDTEIGFDELFPSMWRDAWKVALTRSVLRAEFLIMILALENPNPGICVGHSSALHPAG